MSSPAWVPLGPDTQSPKALWKLEDTGSSVADASGNGNAGSFVGGVTKNVAGARVESKCVEFDGTSGYLTFPTSASLDPVASAWSVAAWVYATAARAGPGDTGCCVVTKQWPTTGAIPFALGYGYTPGVAAVDNRVWATFYTGAVFATAAVDPVVLPLTTWRHFVAVFNGSTLKLYRDGVEVASVAASGDVARADLVLIGRRWIANTATPYFPGRVDDVRIYNRALQAAEVAALFGAGADALAVPAWIPSN